MSRFLDKVTLICVDCDNPVYGAKALAYSTRNLKFARVCLLSDKLVRVPYNAEFIRIPKIETLDAYNLFSLWELTKYVHTEFCLSIHSDGFVINPECWTDEFLQWDYLGAPWPPTTDPFHYAYYGRGGNSGFCLRSKRFLEATANLPWYKFAEHVNARKKIIDDVLICRDSLLYFESLGYKICNQDIAWKFSREEPISGRSWNLDDCFGFHGKLTPETRKCCMMLLDYSI